MAGVRWNGNAADHLHTIVEQSVAKPLPPATVAHGKALLLKSRARSNEVQPVAGTVCSKLKNPQLDIDRILSAPAQYRQLTSLGSTTALSTAVFVLRGAIRPDSNSPDAAAHKQKYAEHIAKQLPEGVVLKLYDDPAYQVHVTLHGQTRTVLYPYYKVTLTDSSEDKLGLMTAAINILSKRSPFPIWHQAQHGTAMTSMPGVPHVVVQPAHVHKAIAAEHILYAKVTITGDKLPTLPTEARLSAILTANAEHYSAIITPDTTSDAARKAGTIMRLLEMDNIAPTRQKDHVVLMMHLSSATSAMEAAGEITITTDVGTAVIQTNLKSSTGLDYAVAFLVPDKNWATQAGIAAIIPAINDCVYKYHSKMVQTVQAKTSGDATYPTAAAAAAAVAAATADPLPAEVAAANAAAAAAAVRDPIAAADAAVAGDSAPAPTVPDVEYLFKPSVRTGMPTAQLLNELAPEDMTKCVYTVRGIPIHGMSPILLEALFSQTSAVPLLINYADMPSQIIALMAFDAGEVYFKGTRLLGAVTHHSAMGRTGWLGVKNCLLSVDMMELLMAATLKKSRATISRKLATLPDKLRTNLLADCLQRVLKTPPAPLAVPVVTSPGKLGAAMLAETLEAIATGVDQGMLDEALAMFDDSDDEENTMPVGNPPTAPAAAPAAVAGAPRHSSGPHGPTLPAPATKLPPSQRGGGRPAEENAPMVRTAQRQAARHAAARMGAQRLDFEGGDRPSKKPATASSKQAASLGTSLGMSTLGLDRAAAAAGPSRMLPNRMPRAQPPQQAQSRSPASSTSGTDRDDGRTGGDADMEHEEQ